MAKKIGYAILVILLLLLIAGFLGMRSFNNMWFNDKPNYLTYSYDAQPIYFDWSRGNHGDYVEEHEAIIIPVTIQGVSCQLSWQFDTGSPHSYFLGNAVESLDSLGAEINVIEKDEIRLVDQLDFTMGGSSINASMFVTAKENGKGQVITKNDSTCTLRLGTIGADMMDDKITVINFKNQFIQFYDDRTDWMKPLNFKSFSFAGRRFMLPSIIDDKELDLFYDSGSSAFGLITSKNRYDRYTDKAEEEITLEVSGFADQIPIHHKRSIKDIFIGGAQLDLKRISYIGIYAKFQGLMTPFTRIGGWLGNKPFLDHTMIIDTRKQEFVIIESKD